MGLHERKYAFDRVFAVKQMMWKMWVLLRIAAVFQSTESSLEMKAIKKTYSDLILVILVFCFNRFQFTVETIVKSFFGVFADMTYRWHHRPRRLVQLSLKNILCNASQMDGNSNSGSRSEQGTGLSKSEVLLLV